MINCSPAMSKVAKVKFINYETSVAKALDLIQASSNLPKTGLIIIKPNLTNADAPPVTANVKAVEAVYKYCISHSKGEIAISESCGNGITMDRLNNRPRKSLGYLTPNEVFYKRKKLTG